MVYGRRGETIGDHDRSVVIAPGELRPRFVAQAAAQVGAPQIRGAVAGLTVQRYMRQARQCKRGRVQFVIYRIARAGVVQLKAQELVRGQAMTRAPQRNACRCEGFQVNSHVGGWISGSSSGRCDSQASNSGAGRSPRSERRYSASWKLVLW